MHLPTTETPEEPRKAPSPGLLLIEGLCPMLIVAAIFTLAAAVTRLHPAVGFTASFSLLVLQSLHAGAVQLNYVKVQSLLLKREKELQSANVAMEKLSMLDPLTAVPNRRRFDTVFDEAWRRAIRKKTPIALLIIDVDFFKGINDLHGHKYGDECLVAVARILRQEAGRPDDLLARYGGDEFALLLPETNGDGAMVVAERMHTAIHLLRAANDASPFQGFLTITIGIGAGVFEIGSDQAMLIEVADQALYQAKNMGEIEPFFQKVIRSTRRANAMLLITQACLCRCDLGF